jgi:hypothetical protein
VRKYVCVCARAHVCVCVSGCGCVCVCVCVLPTRPVCTRLVREVLSVRSVNVLFQRLHVPRRVQRIPKPCSSTQSPSRLRVENGVSGNDASTALCVSCHVMGGVGAGEAHLLVILMLLT